MAKSAARIEFLTDILSTAIEGGINHWADIESIKTVEDSTDILGWRYDSAEIVDEDGKTHMININTIVKGINLVQKQNMDRDKNLILANRTNGYDGDFDALDADKIVQFGLFSDLVYA